MDESFEDSEEESDEVVDTNVDPSSITHEYEPNHSKNIESIPHNQRVPTITKNFYTERAGERIQDFGLEPNQTKPGPSRIYSRPSVIKANNPPKCFSGLDGASEGYEGRVIY